MTFLIERNVLPSIGPRVVAVADRAPLMFGMDGEDGGSRWVQELGRVGDQNSVCEMHGADRGSWVGSGTRFVQFVGVQNFWVSKISMGVQDFFPRDLHFSIPAIPRLDLSVRGCPSLIHPTRLHPRLRHPAPRRDPTGG